MYVDFVLQICGIVILSSRYKFLSDFCNNDYFKIQGNIQLIHADIDNGKKFLLKFYLCCPQKHSSEMYDIILALHNTLFNEPRMSYTCRLCPKKGVEKCTVHGPSILSFPLCEILLVNKFTFFTSASMCKHLLKNVLPPFVSDLFCGGGGDDWAKTSEYLISIKIQIRIFSHHVIRYVRGWWSVVQDGMFLVVKYHIIRPPPACLGQAVK